MKQSLGFRHASALAREHTHSTDVGGTEIRECGESSVRRRRETVDTASPVRKRMRRVPSSTVDCWHTLRTVFGKSEYRGQQEAIMQAAITGLDILVIAPTGMGKSLCFQVPAVAELHGLTLVVSPLLALMHDQVETLRTKYKVPAASLSSATKPDLKAEVLKDLASGHPRNRLLYLTPEKLCHSSFADQLHLLVEQQELSRLVIDEAHCISDWGHNFRPEYRQLKFFRQKYPSIPIMALTATATRKVQDDIIKTLGMDQQNFKSFVHGFDRPNLYYEVRYRSDTQAERLDDLTEYIFRLNKAKGYILERSPDGKFPERRVVPAGIVYCRTRAACEVVADHLRKHGLYAKPYHKGPSLTEHALGETMRRWTEANELREVGKPWVDIIVATIAFGMGIDKADVRYVVHWDLPKSFEGFYQETGRAGRDGEESICLLYYSRDDRSKVRRMAQEEYRKRKQGPRSDSGSQGCSQSGPNSTEALIDLCETVDRCRHQMICDFFGDVEGVHNILLAKSQDPKRLGVCGSMCDFCRHGKRVREEFEKNIMDDESYCSSAEMDDLETIAPRPAVKQKAIVERLPATKLLTENKPKTAELMTDNAPLQEPNPIDATGNLPQSYNSESDNDPLSLDDGDSFTPLSLPSSLPDLNQEFPGTPLKAVTDFTTTTFNGPQEEICVSKPRKSASLTRTLGQNVITGCHQPLQKSTSQVPPRVVGRTPSQATLKEIAPVRKSTFISPWLGEAKAKEKDKENIPQAAILEFSSEPDRVLIFHFRAKNSRKFSIKIREDCGAKVVHTLQRALASANASGRALWQYWGGDVIPKREELESILVKCAEAVDETAFWRSSTSSFYQRLISRRVDDIVSSQATSETCAEASETVQALRRVLQRGS